MIQSVKELRKHKLPIKKLLGNNWEDLTSWNDSDLFRWIKLYDNNLKLYAIGIYARQVK